MSWGVVTQIHFMESEGRLQGACASCSRSDASLNPQRQRCCPAGRDAWQRYTKLGSDSEKDAIFL